MDDKTGRLIQQKKKFCQKGGDEGYAYIHTGVGHAPLWRSLRGESLFVSAREWKKRWGRKGGRDLRRNRVLRAWQTWRSWERNGAASPNTNQSSFPLFTKDFSSRFPLHLGREREDERKKRWPLVHTHRHLKNAPLSSPSFLGGAWLCHRINHCVILTSDAPTLPTKKKKEKNRSILFIGSLSFPHHSLSHFSLSNHLLKFSKRF